MLIKSTIYQLSSAGISKLFGFFITAFLYRLYSLDEIGKFYLLLSIFGIFVAIQQIGSEKPLINYNIKNKKKKEYQIIKTKFIISLVISPIFFSISYNLFDSSALFVSLMMTFTFILSSLNIDYILIAKKKFLKHSVVTLLVQLMVFIFFGLSFYLDLKPQIIFRQFIPTFLLQLLFFILILNLVKINFKKIIYSKLISIDYLKENKIIILNYIFISLITGSDLILAKNILNDNELGIIAGLFQYSLLSFGFLIIISKILYSYAINTENSKKFKSSSKFLINIYSFISVIGLAILLYPYLKYIMNLKEISEILIPGIIITITVFLMPSFFLEINKIEISKKKLPINPLLIFIIITMLVYFSGGTILAKIYSEKLIYYLLSIMFLTKWLTLYFGILYLNKKFKIN
ncbi:hypothetical protein [Candidatus Pelagibacter communis]|uniref:hypothetical protein n=1 Tax=Pelagibacter ubique TaxID=198252 RepID=UPI00094D4052|nr:hypothetical protein [Candidatus Pelagibacter ubique]